MSSILKKCPNCVQLYTLKSLPTKENSNNIPLYLKCGHSICDKCAIYFMDFSEPIECKVCHNQMVISISDLTLFRGNFSHIYHVFPVNIYMLGELSLDLLQTKREKMKEDEDRFINLTAVIQNTETSQGQCIECSRQSKTMCLQCSVVVCKSCFKKSHNNFAIFENHKLLNIEEQLSFNKCKVHHEKDLDYYCKDCSKSISLLVGGEKSCIDHNLATTQEMNDQILQELAQISPKVEETYKRLTKTAVDVGYLLDNFENEAQNTYMKKLEIDIEQHYSRLTYQLQIQKKKVSNVILDLKKAEKKSLESVKKTLLNLIKNAKIVFNAIEKPLSQEEIKQVNLSVLLEDAKSIVNSPWYLSYNKSSTKVSVDNKLTNVLTEFIQIEIKSVGSYQLLATADLDPSIEILPPPNAPVYLPESSKDIREPKQTKPTTKKEDEKKHLFFGTPPTYYRKHNSVSSFISVNRESSHKVTDDNYCKKKTQTVSPFVEIEQPKQLHAGGKELIYISQIITPHNFFVQRDCHQVMVEELQKQFRDAVSYPVPSISCITEGKIYLVFNKIVNLWQRGRIIDVDKKEINKPILRVFCIDFGSTVVVTIDKLRLIPAERIQSLLPLAINCSLSNCKPVSGSWTSDDAVLMQNIANNKQAVLHVHRVLSKPACNANASVECDVTTFEYDVSLAHALVFHERAYLVNPEAPYPRKATVLNNPKLFISNNDFKLKTIEKVYITHIDSPDNFYVRKLHLQNAYKELCEELEQNYGLSVNTDTIYLPKTDMVCVVNLGKYNLPDADMSDSQAYWARAIVKELPGRGRVRLLLPDCGATLLAHWSALRHIRPNLTIKCALATKCHLSPSYKNWSPGSARRFQTFRDRPLELYVEESSKHSLGVTLYYKTDTEKVICINNEIAENKFAVPFGMSMPNKGRVLDEQQESPTPTNSITVFNKNAQESNNENKELVAKDKVILRLEAKVLSYQSPSLIYVSLVHQQETLDAIFEDIQRIYSKKTFHSKTNWNVGDKCCTLCQQSQTWRRAAIVEIDGENAKVFYSDFACIETVPVSGLMELIPEFSSVDYAAVKCHLCGVVPAGGEKWPSLSKEYLKDMLDVYKKVYITKVGDFRENSMPVEMWVYHTTHGGALEPTTYEWRCLNKKIVEQGLAIPDTSLQAKTISSVNNDASDKKLSFLNVTGSVEECLQSEPLPMKPLVMESDSVTHTTLSTEVECELNSKIDEKTDTVFISDWMPPTPPQSKQFVGVPTHVDSDGIIYLHDISQQDSFDLIRNSLDVYFNEPDPGPKCGARWTVGEPCVAMYSMDCKFYRARITEVNEEASTCWVHYIDYGNEENCPFDNLRKSIALYKIPSQALKCVLNRIEPIAENWDEQTLDYLYKCIGEKQCLVEICGEAKEDIYPIKLKCDKLWIDDHLVDFEMAKYSDGSKAIITKFAPVNE